MPQPMTLLVPVATSTLAGWLKSDQLPQWLNDVIVVIAFVLAVLLCIATGSPLTANASTNIALIITYCAAIFAVLTETRSRLAAKTSSPLEGLLPDPAVTSTVTTQGTTSSAISPLPGYTYKPAQTSEGGAPPSVITPRLSLPTTPPRPISLQPAEANDQAEIPTKPPVIPPMNVEITLPPDGEHHDAI